MPFGDLWALTAQALVDRDRQDTDELEQSSLATSLLLGLRLGL